MKQTIKIDKPTGDTVSMMVVLALVGHLNDWMGEGNFGCLTKKEAKNLKSAFTMIGDVSLALCERTEVEE